MPETTKTVHENIRLMKSGHYRVCVLTDYLGTFHDLSVAIKVRDEYRKKEDLPPAKY